MKPLAGIFVFLVAIFLASAGSPRNRAFEGIWAGTAELPERTIDEIVLIIVGSEDGLSGTISDSLEILRAGTADAAVCPDGNALVLSFPTVDGLPLTVALKAHGDRLTGVWTDPDGRSGKIELDRRYAPVSENPH